jgi:signal transduction histidine kinase
MTPQDPNDNRAREFQGLVRLLEDLGSATENVFSRLYNGLMQRKVRMDADQFYRFREQAELNKVRLRQQTLEIARLTGILGKIDEGVVMQNPEGRIILMNEAARVLVGSPRQFWQSELGAMFRIANDMPLDGDGMQPLGKTTTVPVNDLLLGVKIAAIMHQGELLGTIMLINDSTEDSVASRIKDSFIGRISHEFRTPLTSIKGMSDVLLNIPEGTPPKRAFLETINRNVVLLDRMVVELLDVSELASGKIDVRMDPVNLDDLAFTVLKGYEGRIVQANLNAQGMVANQRALNIKGDDRRLRWAIGHLIDNAINYNVAGGQVLLQMGRVSQQRVLLEVEDTGVGIDQKDLPRIFERFYRGEPRSPEGKLLDPRGLGQGLFIAQKVVEAHGGYIGVHTEPGVGTRFTVGLPLAG